MNKLPALTGWQWLKQGARLFRKQPTALTTLLFANILISIGISAFPYVGPLVAVVLIPSFSMAFMQACALIDQGQRVAPAVLLTGFRKPAVGALCRVGLIYMAVSLLLAVVSYFLIDQDFMKQVAAAQADPKAAPQVDLSDLLGILGVMVLYLSVLMALCFAAPLTYWQKMGPGKAIFYSFFAVWRSARVFVVLLLSWFGIFVLVSRLITMVFDSSDLGRVVLLWVIFLFILLLQCAMYAAYRQLFGAPELDTPKVDVHA
jgi:hypothetical protein